MHSNYINKLLNLKEVKVKNIINAVSYIKIYLQSDPREHSCPSCGATTSKIHDYREQVNKDLPFQFKDIYLILRKLGMLAHVENVSMKIITFYLAITV